MSKKALKSVRAALTRECTSYERLPALVKIYDEGWGLSDAEYLTLLGEEWTGFDNVSAYDTALSEILGDTGSLPQMMTAEEQAALAALPETVTLYRSAEKGVNERGWCWSLDRAEAVRFATHYGRYRKLNPVLVTATAKRDDIVAVKLDRDETEVIVRTVTVLEVRDLPAPPAPSVTPNTTTAARRAGTRRKT